MVKVMEIEKVTIFNDINPVIQKQLHEHYKLWAKHRKDSELIPTDHHNYGKKKCNNCKKYFDPEEMVTIRYRSNKNTHQCKLCNETIAKGIRIKRR